MEDTQNIQSTENKQNDKPQWYVLQTLSGYEKMVQSNLFTMVENNNLQDKIIDIVVPEEEEITEKNGKKKVVMRRKYPCYVFIKMIYTKHVWYMVTQTRGVTCFCGPQGRPVPITEEEVKRNQLERITEEELDFKVGDQIEVLGGALKDFVGEVKEINFDTQKVKVIVSMFGRETPVDIEFINIRKINA